MFQRHVPGLSLENATEEVLHDVMGFMPLSCPKGQSSHDARVAFMVNSESLNTAGGRPTNLEEVLKVFPGITIIQFLDGGWNVVDWADGDGWTPDPAEVLSEEEVAAAKLAAKEEAAAKLAADTAVMLAEEEVAAAKLAKKTAMVGEEAAAKLAEEEAAAAAKLAEEEAAAAEKLAEEEAAAARVGLRVKPLGKKVGEIKGHRIYRATGSIFTVVPKGAKFTDEVYAASDRADAFAHAESLSHVGQ
jgi:hypothetical protein